MSLNLYSEHIFSIQEARVTESIIFGPQKDLSQTDDLIMNMFTLIFRYHWWLLVGRGWGWLPGVWGMNKDSIVP